MTPGARIATVIEALTTLIELEWHSEQLLSKFFRKRRFIGAKDRREISRLTFNVLRHYARLSWWTKNGSPRLLTIASLALVDGYSCDAISQLFNNSKYAPKHLSSFELEFLRKVDGQTINNSTMQEWDLNEVPKWLLQELKATWPSNFVAQMAALNQPAPLDLRVNLKKTCRENIIKLLENDGIIATPTPFSPAGLRIEKRTNLYNTLAYTGGYVEVQDEGSQLIALLVDPKPNQTIIDLCSGGGGKTLSIATTSKHRGTLIACDVDAEKLKRAKIRYKRAGVENITQKAITGSSDPWLSALARSANRVLLDVPCSRTGIWRRSPIAKWSLTPVEVGKYIEQQLNILEYGSRLVGVGGRLIYATCSILSRENEDQIKLFLKQNPQFSLIPICKVWDEVFNSQCPSSDPFLNLTPETHNTDGFFCAIMERLD
ncbi:MAG: RsmB/NOP family class I SAM-dependent RNA methyltransferase [Pseudomonadota bacterium]|nr:RsmB/NOP family class I SAM-dependent RNA methyltransferase [Pseudomonadota bacterium]